MINASNHIFDNIFFLTALKVDVKQISPEYSSAHTVYCRPLLYLITGRVACAANCRVFNKLASLWKHCTALTPPDDQPIPWLNALKELCQIKCPVVCQSCLRPDRSRLIDNTLIVQIWHQDISMNIWIFLGIIHVFKHFPKVSLIRFTTSPGNIQDSVLRWKSNNLCLLFGSYAQRKRTVCQCGWKQICSQSRARGSDQRVQSAYKAQVTELISVVQTPITIRTDFTEHASYKKHSPALSFSMFYSFTRLNQREFIVSLFCFVFYSGVKTNVYK